MKRRIAIFVLAAATLGGCAKAADTKSGGTVKDSTSTTSTSSAPSTTTTAGKSTTSTTARPSATTTTEKVTTTSTTSAVATSYANCSAVKAAGKAPLYEGQPGYSSKLDRDGDGVACET
jgi:hypothetical protein